MAIAIDTLRKTRPQILCLGSHRAITQSILDFDHLQGHSPSILGVIATGHKSERYFYGDHEIVVPVWSSLGLVPEKIRASTTLALNVQSGRRAYASTVQALSELPKLGGITIFAERLPEQQALALADQCRLKGVWCIGGSSVGLVIPTAVKLGAIGGTETVQLTQSRLTEVGTCAVISTSGGMVNEIIRAVALAGYGISFALALGGERFPIVSAADALLAAEHDSATKVILYFGELGGQDEYQLADMIRQGTITKPVICYIAGIVAELFPDQPQFGHAKAMAASQTETAGAKKTALQAVGAIVVDSFGDYIAQIAQIDGVLMLSEPKPERVPTRPRHRPFASSLSYDQDDDVYILGEPLLDFTTSRSFAAITGCMLLGKSTISPALEESIDFVLRLLVDHGPYVSGAVNTMVAARAGKDLVSSLTAGLLTIGPRFGGAINEAARIWLSGVTEQALASEFIERYAAKGVYVAGIGHKKYSVTLPDPRVERLLKFADALPAHPYTEFAQAVAHQTSQKKANLILNVDGAIAAILLDVLHEKEGYGSIELAELIDQEFFNALFVLARSVGCMGHYFDQRRLDEGLFRLSPEDVAALTDEI